MSITVEGRLARNAEVRFESSTVASVYMTIEAAGVGQHPVDFRLRIGSQWAAQDLARSLKATTRVVVKASGVRVRTDHSYIAAVLTDVESVMVNGKSVV